MKFLFILSFLIFVKNAGAAVPALETQKPEYCQSAAELKKIHSFLKAQKELSLTDQQVLNLSVQVADHCNGASDRFQKVYQRLSQAGVAIPKTIEVALEFSDKSDTQVKLFTESFKLLFLEKKYDLSFYDSYQWARAYASAPESQQKTLGDDLKFLIQFCMEDKKDLLPLPLCRDFTLSLLEIATLEHRGSIKDDFKKLLSFLSDRQGPRYPIEKSLEISLEVLKLGAGATKQFIETFQFAISRKGLALGPEQSYKIAFRSAQSSQKNP
jgi:hypothetical protein